MGTFRFDTLIIKYFKAKRLFSVLPGYNSSGIIAVKEA
jgi:hypothetical protein